MMREPLVREEATEVLLCERKVLEEVYRTEKEVEEGEGKRRDDSLLLALTPMVRSKSQGATRRRVTPTPTPIVDVEKPLPNGDMYMGSFSGGFPNGSGKYLWKDGCMYEGEWRRGKASGKGKFSWPSGASYEGEFKSGRMEGFGTFIGVDGDTYRGSWVGDKKHGHGVKRYANGEFYEGTWRRNLQDGRGRYVWLNGNEYSGEWRNGVICGKGVLFWPNGNRYEGVWENGVVKGSGVFTWADGRSWIGCWNESGGVMKSFFDGVEKSELGGGNRKRSSVDSGVGEKIFPRICIWESDGEAGDITCDIVDNVEASVVYRDRISIDCDGFRQFRKNPCCFSGEAKKPGETISKGHKKYDLMLNLQHGIR